jgi:hypothetical protein
VLKIFIWICKLRSDNEFFSSEFVLKPIAPATDPLPSLPTKPKGRATPPEPPVRFLSLRERISFREITGRRAGGPGWSDICCRASYSAPRVLTPLLYVAGLLAIISCPCFLEFPGLPLTAMIRHLVPHHRLVSSRSGTNG